MESFVPFGGFFSAPSDLNLPISSSYQCVPRNHPCNEKCGQEAYAAPKGGVAASVAGQHQASLPSWLQMAPLGTNKGFDTKVCITINTSSIQRVELSILCFVFLDDNQLVLYHLLGF